MGGGHVPSVPPGIYAYVCVCQYDPKYKSHNLKTIKKYNIMNKNLYLFFHSDTAL